MSDSSAKIIVSSWDMDHSGILDPRVVHFLMANGMLNAARDYLDSISGSSYDDNCNLIRALMISLLEVRDEAMVETEDFQRLLSDLTRNAKKLAENSRLSMSQMGGNSSNIMPTKGSSDDDHCNSTPALEISLLEVSLSRDGSEVEVDGSHSLMCDSANDSTKYSRPSVSQLSGNSSNITPTTVPMAAEILEVVQDTRKEEVPPRPELEPEMVIAKKLAHNTEAAWLHLANTQCLE
ncbi:hypothetical protein ACP70R_041780 [Stipagrostis hirtigluma subsp. patula]